FGKVSQEQATQAQVLAQGAGLEGAHAQIGADGCYFLGADGGPLALVGAVTACTQAPVLGFVPVTDEAVRADERLVHRLLGHTDAAYGDADGLDAALQDCTSSIARCGPLAESGEPPG